MDREDYTHKAASGALEQDKQHPYEPPTLTTLGSFTELTKAEGKSGPVTDPGFATQPSRA